MSEQEYKEMIQEDKMSEQEYKEMIQEYKELIEIVDKHLPFVSVEHDNEGQVVLYTGVYDPDWE